MIAPTNASREPLVSDLIIKLTAGLAPSAILANKFSLAAPLL